MNCYASMLNFMELIQNWLLRIFCVKRGDEQEVKMDWILILLLKKCNVDQVLIVQREDNWREISDVIGNVYKVDVEIG